MRDLVTLGARSASPRATTRTPCSSSSGSTSLTRNPLAPARNAPNTCSSSSNVVRTTTRTAASCGSAVIRRVAVRPSTSGMLRSISTTSGRSSRARATAVPPLGASPTIVMSSADSRSIRKPARTSAWSSASSTRIIGRDRRGLRGRSRGPLPGHAGPAWSATARPARPPAWPAAAGSWPGLVWPGYGESRRDLEASPGPAAAEKLPPTAAARSAIPVSPWPLGRSPSAAAGPSPSSLTWMARAPGS